MSSTNELQHFNGFSVGDDLPELIEAVDQNMIDAYADASGDVNPLHIDPEFAKTTIFGGTIAHGLLTLAFVSRVLSAWNWQGWAYGGELDIVFLGPVRPGDTVRVCAKIDAIEQREDGVYARCSLACYCGEKAVVKGTVISKI
jgi:3-hydroxybutyryl-CoA dehydratase